MGALRRAARITGCLVVAIGVLSCAALRVDTEPQVIEGPEPDRVIEVSAERFLFTPSEITMEAGTVLEIRLSSQDTDHGFRIVGPGDVNVSIPKRGRGGAVARFAPTEPGDYRFECSLVCGAGHNYMRGVIRVVAATAGSSDAVTMGGSPHAGAPTDADPPSGDARQATAGGEGAFEGGSR